jgi:hypothetical protein
MEKNQRMMKSKKLWENKVGLGLSKKGGIPVTAILTCGLLVSGCDGTQAIVAVSEPDPSLNFVRGYRSAGDPCQLTGETDFTRGFLDDASDLVTCPTGHPAASSLVSENGAVVVTQANSLTIFSVPRH